MLNHIIYILKKKFDRYIHDPFIALFVIPFFLLLKVLPYQASSFLCGTFVSLVAPLTKYQSRVIKHLSIAFPKKEYNERLKISKKFWFNFGQIIGELPHIDKIISSGNLETFGLNRIKNGPAILIGAHLANWEFLLRIGELSDRKVGFVYRPMNNWILNKIQISRNSKINADFYKKGRIAAIGMANKLKKGEMIGLTNDQILREGIMVPFFGKKTPTPQAAAVMSLKWKIPIFMVKVERIKKFKFKMTVEKKLDVPKIKSNDEDIYLITKKISERIEEWIIKNPEQWLWAHRRWGK